MPLKFPNLHFENAEQEVVYVGRASGYGTPEKVLKDRLTKGHHIFDNNPELKPKVKAVSGIEAYAKDLLEDLDD